MMSIAVSGDKIEFEQKEQRWECNREAFRNVCLLFNLKKISYNFLKLY